jgi:hypothetical protein
MPRKSAKGRSRIDCRNQGGQRRRRLGRRGRESPQPRAPRHRASTRRSVASQPRTCWSNRARAGWVAEAAAERSDFKLEVLDLRDWLLPFFDQPASPARVGGGYSNPVVERWTQS